MYATVTASHVENSNLRAVTRDGRINVHGLAGDLVYLSMDADEATELAEKLWQAVGELKFAAAMENRTGDEG